MNTNVNLEAAAGALLFLGACFVLSVCGAIIIHAVARGRRARARRVSFFILAGLGLYLAATLAFSLSSKERLLARGEEKYFCEIDCHLAYSIVGVSRLKTIGDGADGATAAGDFHVVTVRTRFDETTITPRRGDFPLTPNPRVLRVTDEWGNSYGVSAAGQRALARAGGGGTPLLTPLRPGESYTTEVVFDLPREAKSPLLSITEALLPTYFIIGHENSLLHQRTRFQLDAQTRLAFQ
jgi:hypothetical protein